MVCQKKGPQVSGGMCILLYSEENEGSFVDEVGLKTRGHKLEGRWRGIVAQSFAQIAEAKGMHFASVLPL